MRASCLPLSFHQKRGATERGWVQNRPFSFEWKDLIWIGRHCSHSFVLSLKKLCFCWISKRRIFLPDETYGNAAVGDTLLSQVSVPLPGWAGYEVDVELSQLKFVNRTHFQFKVKVKSIDFIFAKSFRRLIWFFNSWISGDIHFSCPQLRVVQKQCLDSSMHFVCMT